MHVQGLNSGVLVLLQSLVFLFFDFFFISWCVCVYVCVSVSLEHVCALYVLLVYTNGLTKNSPHLVTCVTYLYVPSVLFS